MLHLLTWRTWRINLLKHYNGATRVPSEETRTNKTDKCKLSAVQVVFSADRSRLDRKRHCQFFYVIRRILLMSVFQPWIWHWRSRKSKKSLLSETLSKRHKGIWLDWCNIMRIGLMVKPWLLGSWRISDEVRVSLDGQGLSRIYILRGELRFDEHFEASDWLIHCCSYSICTCIGFVFSLFSSLSLRT